ncbi:hypothetical protein GmHk_06G017508 [Glycine max]|nr:hypothetical protein GmHk_06G017508 [Glycine max]
MNDSSNKHHCVCIISVDLWVYVKLCPHRQTTVSDSKYTKLSKCYYGLFCVLERIRVVANRLDPPLTRKLICLPYSLPPLTLGNDPIVSPLAILDSKVTDVDGIPTHFWMEFSPEGTTWEKWDELCKAYNLKDKVDFERGNIDRNEPNIIEPID